jgi:hypothetical protein
MHQLLYKFRRAADPSIGVLCERAAATSQLETEAYSCMPVDRKKASSCLSIDPCMTC